MNTRKFSEALGELNDKYVDEAVDYRKAKKPVWAKLGAAAACLALVAAIGSIRSLFHGGMIVSAYTYVSDKEITTAGAVMSSGSISDTGEMKGHPLMFYLSGKDIVSVRFSCKNQQINFVDWTEERDEYGNAQNFTVAYGDNESDYYYLTIDWVPNSLIRELTDNHDSTIATLPEEMRHDVIVMEITFENGKTATKAVTISLLNDGTFFAAFDDYKISPEDTFINRPDSESIPRDILYCQDNISEPVPGTSGGNGSEPVPGGELPGGTDISEHSPSPETDQMQPTQSEPTDSLQAPTAEPDHQTAESGTEIFDALNKLEYQPYTCDGLPEYTLTDPDGTVYSINISAKWVWRGKDKQADLPDEIISWLQADKAARSYYANTVFKVVSLELKSETEDRIIFSVCVSKGGTVQEPNRTITLQLNHGTWEVINEGY